jgi:hypothetical protein
MDISWANKAKELQPPLIKENRRLSWLSDYSWSMPEKHNPIWLGLPFHLLPVCKAFRNHGKLPLWNVFISLPLRLSSLNRCQCFVVACITRTIGTHIESGPDQEIPVSWARPRLLRLWPQCWGLLGFHWVKGKRLDMPLLLSSSKLRDIIVIVLYLENLFTLTVKLGSLFLQYVFVQGFPN